MTSTDNVCPICLEFSKPIRQPGCRDHKTMDPGEQHLLFVVSMGQNIKGIRSSLPSSDVRPYISEITCPSSVTCTLTYYDLSYTEPCI